MKLKIAQLGQPVLRRRAVEVATDEIAAPEFQDFLDAMRETLISEQGAGLAAPQVFAGRRVFLAMVERPADDSPHEYETFINPKITAVSEETQFAWEGCLSFPELLVLVRRHRAVRVEYLDRQGRPRTLELQGFPARVVQHEFDHLEGILTIDRAESTQHIIKASELDAVLLDESKPTRSVSDQT